MNIWPFNTSDNKEEEKNEVRYTPVKLSHYQAMKQQYETFVVNNLPVGFEKKIEQAKPFIWTSFLAWPVYWIYRGLEWNNYRPEINLPNYIQKTYFRAKLLQISIIVFGLTMAFQRENKHRQMAMKLMNQTKD